MSTKETKRNPFWRCRAGLAVCVLAAAAGLMLVLEHRAHLLVSAPLLVILLLCIGMHFFMHGGHGGHRDDMHAGHGREDERGK